MRALTKRSLRSKTLPRSRSLPEISEKPISCPYCGEPITILVDGSLPMQNYIEDCEVCCRPIVLDVSVDVDGDVAVLASRENE